MVDKASSAERTEFSKRLITSLQNQGASESGTALAKAFNFRSPHHPITVHAARKWLLGESIPTQEKVIILADWLEVSPAWLRFGGLEGLSAKPNLDPMRAALTSDIAILSSEECRVVRILIDVLLKRKVERS